MTQQPLTDQQLDELQQLIDRTTPVGAVTASPGLLGMLVAEVRRLRSEHAPYEMLAPQQCAAGKHADWLVDSEYAHACPWCEIEKLRAATGEGVIRDACACKGVVHADDCEVYRELLRTNEPTPEPPMERLAARWEQLADQGDTAIGHFEGPTAVTLNAEVEERGRVYRQAAADLREVLATGRIPDDLRTPADEPAAAAASGGGR